MQSVPKKIFQILDGTPAVYGQYSRGQSMAELALVTPLLIVMLMGLAEIGWFANNYLILLETTRVGARYGAVQTGDTAPYNWDNSGSLLPDLQSDAATDGPLFKNAKAYRICINSEAGGTPRFYNTIICKMFDAMSPLDFRGEYDSVDTEPNDRNGVDDIVVSAFSVLSINPLDPDIPSAMRTTIDLPFKVGALSTQQQLVVAGRYPNNANECSTDQASDKDTRDPFNYIDYTVAGNTDTTSPGNTGTRNFVTSSGTKLFSEYLGYDTTAEYQRGFALTGQHVVTSTRALPVASWCYGSEWTINRVQNLINVSNFSMQKQSERSTLPSQGLILVEMFWQHTLLLRNPVFNPVFNILNDPSNPNGGGTIISVWAAFPLPTTEPRNIKFAVGS